MPDDTTSQGGSPAPSGPSYGDPERYAKLTAFEGGYRDLWWDPDFLALTAHRWGLGARGSLLDVGCGAGHWGLTLLPQMRPGARLTGVDHEPTFLGMAEQRATTLGLGSRAEFLPGSLESLPFEDDCFDVVTCQLVLLHVGDVPRALGEMQRVLKPGGVILCCEPDNLAGKVATLGTNVGTSDEDMGAIFELLLRCQRGKRALGEGDERIGAHLPGMMAAAGFDRITTHTNDTALQLFPPYGDPRMGVGLDQEREWAEQGVTVLAWARDDARRHFQASGGSAEDFEVRWAALERWRERFLVATAAGTFSAARGYVMYLVGGHKA